MLTQSSVTFIYRCSLLRPKLVLTSAGATATCMAACLADVGAARQGREAIPHATPTSTALREESKKSTNTIKTACLCFKEKDLFCVHSTAAHDY